MATPLKEERIKRGISADTVALAVNVKQPTINRIENGVSKASPALADRIARYFGPPLTRDQVLFPQDYPVAPASAPTPKPNLRKVS